jgi:hypothetical protein
VYCGKNDSYKMTPANVAVVRSEDVAFVNCAFKHLGAYLLRPTLVYKPKDLNRDWSPRFSVLWDKNGWIRAKTAGNVKLGVSRNRLCDFSS